MQRLDILNGYLPFLHAEDTGAVSILVRVFCADAQVLFGEVYVLLVLIPVGGVDILIELSVPGVDHAPVPEVVCLNNFQHSVANTVGKRLTTFGGVFLQLDIQCDGGVVLDKLHQIGQLWDLVAVAGIQRLQLSQGHFASVEELCLNAIRHAPTNELLYTCLIQALLQQKRFAEARHCYEQINEALHQQLGVSPSPKLQQLYQNICQGKMSQESDLVQVIGSLREKAGQKPAFYCDFDQFRSIYQLEARRAPRTGSCLQVVMLNVGETGRSDTGMSQVLHALVHSLRSSDVVARYSDSQFIIMLPDANLEDSQRVMERVSRAYSKTYPANAAKLQWQIRALEIL